MHVVCSCAYVTFLGNEMHRSRGNREIWTYPRVSPPPGAITTATSPTHCQRPAHYALFVLRELETTNRSMQPLQRACNVVGICALLCLLLGAMQSRAEHPGPAISSLKLSIPYTLGSDQQHLCTVTRVDTRNERYIVTFEPHLQPGHVRHLSLQLCDIIPADALKARVWSCHTDHVVCGGRVQPVYVWGQNSSAWILPRDTGIPLGGPLGQDYLLMQVHLKETDAEKSDHEDSKVDKSESGTEMVSLIVNTTATRPLLEFGLAILQNTGFIPKGSEVLTTESACQWQSEQPVVIAGIRLHTHSRGVWMEALLEHNGRWQVVGEGDPSFPEDVLPVNGTRVVRRGDFLGARCYFRQDPARDIPFGSSWTEEMCNLHVLYLLPIGAAPSIRFQLCTNQVPSIALRHLFPNLPSLRADISPVPEDREVGM